MKTVLKAGVVTLGLGLSMSAMAADSGEASSLFQWVGTIPDGSIGTDTRIVKVDGTPDHDSGTMIFQEVADGEYNIQDSSKLAFNVEHDDGNGNGFLPATSFSYELSSFRFSYGGGLMGSVDDTNPEFEIDANGVTLVKGTPVDNASAENVYLKVGTPSPLDFVTGGDEVVVQSTILVTGATI